MTVSIFDIEKHLFFQTYKRLSLEIIRADGCYLYDRSGRAYLDLFGGLAVNALGYNNPRVKQAICDQVDKYLHISNFFVQEPQVQLAEKLIQATKMDRIFYTNSGTEAIEGAIKLARKWGKGKGKTTLFGLSNSFHGRTMGSLSLTERAKYREGYEPFLPDTAHMKFNDVDELRKKVNAETLAVILELIQGEGGVNSVHPDYILELKELRKKYEFLIIVDEIQTGVGRTGTFLVSEHFRLEPDIVVLAKAIGGGLPLGAFLGNERVAEVFTFGVHGTTFGGNPVSCAAGCAVMEEVVEGGLMENAGRIGAYLINEFKALQKEFPASVNDVRGLGCMLGVELKKDAQPFVDDLLHLGILVNCTNTTVIRFLPPYILTTEQCDHVITTMRDLFKSA